MRIEISVVDGLGLARKLRAEMAAQIAALTGSAAAAEGPAAAVAERPATSAFHAGAVRPPFLTTVRVGEDPASRGVGPMTITMLLSNTLDAYRQRMGAA